MTRVRVIKGISYILLPAAFYDMTYSKILKDDPKIKEEYNEKWKKIKDRGIYLIKNSEGIDEVCYPIHQTELNWIKEKYESII